MIEQLANAADLSVAACFLLAAIFLRVRESVLCMMTFSFFHVVYFMPTTGFEVHITASLANIVAAYYSKPKIARVFLLVSTFQYIMAIDVFLFPDIETILFKVYPIVAFALNLMLLAYLGKGKRFDARKTYSFFGIVRRWSAIISGMVKH